eukprot:scaffold27604_cov141-Isochrysis_galbana.AAC.5
MRAGSVRTCSFSILGRRQARSSANSRKTALFSPKAGPSPGAAGAASQHAAALAQARPPVAGNGAGMRAFPPQLRPFPRLGAPRREAGAHRRKSASAHPPSNSRKSQLGRGVRLLGFWALGRHAVPSICTGKTIGRVFSKDHPIFGTCCAGWSESALGASGLAAAGL